MSQLGKDGKRYYSIYRSKELGTLDYKRQAAANQRVIQEKIRALNIFTLKPLVAAMRQARKAGKR